MLPLHTYIKKFNVVVSTSGVTCKWCGFGETMVFKANKDGEIGDFEDLACRRFDPKRCMQEEHNKIVALAESCTTLEEFLDKTNKVEY